MEHEREELERAGFTEEQADALLAIFAKHPHSHDMEDVIGLEEELAELAEGVAEVEDED